MRSPGTQQAVASVAAPGAKSTPVPFSPERCPVSHPPLARPARSCCRRGAGQQGGFPSGRAAKRQEGQQPAIASASDVGRSFIGCGTLPSLPHFQPTCPNRIPARTHSLTRVPPSPTLGTPPAHQPPCQSGLAAIPGVLDPPDLSAHPPNPLANKTEEQGFGQSRELQAVQVSTNSRRTTPQRVRNHHKRGRPSRPSRHALT